IQAGALPVGHFHVDGPNGIAINASVNPAREVAGDFYDHFIIDEDHIGLTVADVSDKGVPASLFMMLSKALIKNVAMAGHSPSHVMDRVNAQLCENNPENMFVTVWFGIYCIPTRELVYVNAGHEHPVIYRRETGRYDLIVEKHDPVIGLFDDCTFSERTITLSPGDRIFLYTDGVPEATAMDQTMYGTDRMIECLNRNTERSGEEVLAAIVEDTGAFVGEAHQFDDMTMLLLEITDTDTATHSNT
ncbi:MAG: serine/threonine-protein phosphatase, partial [Lachnospiraceae bacterium]|nr:serine/threonine-protein phosphatase [Lachnospiraceae bacterium]